MSEVARDGEFATRLVLALDALPVPPSPPRAPARRRHVAMEVAIAIVTLAGLAMVDPGARDAVGSFLQAVWPPLPAPTFAPTAAPSAVPDRSNFVDGSGSFAVHGVVTDDSGAPVAGASISIQYDGGVHTLLQAATDSQGRYALQYDLAPVGPDASWTVAPVFTVYAPGYEPDVRRRVVTRPEHGFDTRLRQRVAISSGSVDVVLSADDQTCSQAPSDQDAWPCRIVHISEPGPGQVTVSVTWLTDARVGIQLVPWVRSDAACCAAIETVHTSGDVDAQIALLSDGTLARALGIFDPRSPSDPITVTVRVSFKPD